MDYTEQRLTLESLPQAFTHLSHEVGEIRKLVTEFAKQNNTEEDRWFDLIELTAYHPDKPSKATVYSWVQSGTIPVHKGGKKLRFLKSEIDAWLRLGRKKTLAEIEQEADEYLKSKKG